MKDLFPFWVFNRSFITLEKTSQIWPEKKRKQVNSQYPNNQYPNKEQYVVWIGNLHSRFTIKINRSMGSRIICKYLKFYLDFLVCKWYKCNFLVKEHLLALSVYNTSDETRYRTHLAWELRNRISNISLARKKLHGTNLTKKRTFVNNQTKKNMHGSFKKNKVHAW